jgi:pimeloyl-ACP methyl ester carboxylesterase
MDGDLSVINALVAQGYGVAGAGYSRQSINVTEALTANVELIAAFKKKFPTTKKVIAWGQSLGALHTQKLAESNPELVDAVVLGCPAANPADALLAYFGDALWGFKALFNANIKVDGYSTDAATRQKEQLQNIGLVLQALGELKAGLVSGAWPSTSTPAGKALEKAGVPSRAALLAVGLIAGIPTRSTHVDGTSGPASDPQKYALGVAPAVAILENMGTVGVAGTLLLADGELLAGGKVYDNSKTDFAARIEDGRDLFPMGLAGNTAVDAILAALGATPRSTADAKAVAKIPNLIGIKGAISKPTVIMAAESDHYTPAAVAQWYIDKYNSAYETALDAAFAKAVVTGDYVAPAKNLAMLWAKTGASYSKFTDAGSPDLEAPVGPGTGHCLYTADQWLAAAKIAATAVSTGKLAGQATLAYQARKVGLTVDKNFSVPTFKSLS